MKNPIHINEEFICEKCKEHNPKAEKSCRNHCRNCFFSKHVDEETPGDRLSTCLGSMKPNRIDYNSKKQYMIEHLCLKCGKLILNKIAPDDNFDHLLKLINIQNINNGTL